MLLKFRLSWLTSRERSLIVSRICLKCLSSFLCFGITFLFQNDILLKGEKNHSASIFLNGNFTQHYSSCVRAGEKKKEERNQKHGFELHVAYRAERGNCDSAKCFR